MPLVSGSVLHCAGCVDISVLNKFPSFGALYPLQTFTNGIDMNFANVRFFIEANSDKTFQRILNFAFLISAYVEECGLEKRSVLHLGATFSCNFVNHLYTIAQSILGEANLSFDYIKPLIGETYVKACKIEPYNAQTGPAMRGDLDVIEFHLKRLEKDGNYSAVYKLISESIIKMYDTKVDS
jgi:predicted short-subunit dehydrogenase-like oxidoreductase (DUF2520 family)